MRYCWFCALAGSLLVLCLLAFHDKPADTEAAGAGAAYHSILYRA